VLILPASVRADLERWALADHPHETCGVLVGLRDDTATHVEHAVAVHNRASEPTERYDLDPGEFVAADAAARARGLDLVGIWHSHPDRPAEPSALDRAAAWSGWSYLIVALSARGIGDVRSWRLIAGRFDEEQIAQCPPAPPSGALAGGAGSPFFSRRSSASCSSVGASFPMRSSPPSTVAGAT
jgi:proteasome lid subunit RPN8/RPN11